MTRRPLLLLLGLAGCGLSRPYVETRRYPLDPRRDGPPRATGREALLLRPFGAGAGLDGRGLRRLRPDGSLEVAPYDEWLAPPADLAEAALRAWLLDARLFPAVTAAGSRLQAPLVLEAELLRLDVAGGAARARLGVLLLRQDGATRVLAQTVLDAEAPVAGEGWDARAAAMRAALGACFAALEAWIVSGISARETGRR